MDLSDGGSMQDFVASLGKAELYGIYLHIGMCLFSPETGREAACLPVNTKSGAIQ